jgi:coproporphyrinogen III oxidase-like Fe-S oxidoreductase
MVQLRLNRGIDVAAFARSVGLDPLELYAEQIREHGAAGLLGHTPQYIRLTKAGRLLADRVICDFLPAPQDAVLSLKVLAKAGAAGGEDCRTVDPT